MSAIYSLFKCLHYRQTKTSSGNIEHIQSKPDRLGATYFGPLAAFVWISRFRTILLEPLPSII